MVRAYATSALALFILAGLLYFASAWTDSAAVLAVGRLAALLAAGATCAGLLLGISAAMRTLRTIRTALTRVEQFQYERAAAAKEAPEGEAASLGDATLPIKDPPTTDPLGTAPWHEILPLLRDIRDNSLLSAEERREKKLRSADAEFQLAREAVETLIGDHDFVRARQVAEHLRVRRPEENRAEFLMERIEAAREQYESQDVRVITKQVEDLISISAWHRARELVQHLQQRHPDSAEARQLWLRIEREHRLFQDEQRRRMHAEVQRFVSRKRWSEALAAARTFVERFPGCNESEALLLEIPTLASNAEIEVRQQLEGQIMDFVRHGRYIEAAEMARRVIQKYPESPQADALRTQLARLEELANNPDAPPARVRIE